MLKKKIGVKRRENVITKSSLFFFFQCNNLSADQWGFLKSLFSREGILMILVKNKVRERMEKKTHPLSQGPTVLVGCLDQAKKGIDNLFPLSELEKSDFLYIGGFLKNRPLGESDLKKIQLSSEIFFSNLLRVLTLKFQSIPLLSSQLENEKKKKQPCNLL